MRLYWEVARRGFRRYATYRGATFAGVFTNTIFGFMRAYVYLALIHERRVVAGFDRVDLLTYAFVTQALIMIVYLWGWNEVALRVRAGDIAYDLARPYNFVHYWLANDIGRATYHALFRGIPPFLLGALAFHLRLPTAPTTWLWFTLALVLATSVSFALRLLVNLMAFFLLDERGPSRLMTAIWTMMSGFIVPVTFFPSAVASLARSLPFVSMVQLPVEIFLEHRHGWAVARAIGSGLVWTVVLILLCHAVLRIAQRRLVVQGG